MKSTQPLPLANGNVRMLYDWSDPFFRIRARSKSSRRRPITGSRRFTLHANSSRPAASQLREQHSGRVSPRRHTDRPVLKAPNRPTCRSIEATKFELVINLKTAKSLGLIVPPSCSPAPTR